MKTPTSTHFDLVGVGIGPFNLSLAAVLAKHPEFRTRFFDRKPRFEWHSEVMFDDSYMQTNYLKDLVTPVDPTSPYTFLNYLANQGLFHPFLNTGRTVVSRREFELYCTWVSERLAHRLGFGEGVERVDFADDRFHIHTSAGDYTATHLCIATGLVPRIPSFVTDYIGPRVLHAKSPEFRSLDLRGKRVAIIGGGQTGIEVYRNVLEGKWNEAREVRLFTSRRGLEPLDESAFTNEIFTPNYLDRFWDLAPEKKWEIVESQKLTSDGNTPDYLATLYRDLYRRKFVDGDARDLRIFACRKLTGLVPEGDHYRLSFENSFLATSETVEADVVILCTGFRNVLPAMIEPLRGRLRLDAQDRFHFRKSYAVEWDGPADHRIYALNFSRHLHGIVDPQTSLMAWRSAVIANDLLGSPVYRTDQPHPNFVQFGAP